MGQVLSQRFTGCGVPKLRAANFLVAVPARRVSRADHVVPQGFLVIPTTRPLLHGERWRPFPLLWPVQSGERAALSIALGNTSVIQATISSRVLRCSGMGMRTSRWGRMKGPHAR